MSPAFERRLARIDKAFDRIRADRDAEESRLGLAEFYFKCAIVDCVTREYGPEAAMWVLGGPEPPLGFHHRDTKDTEGVRGI